MKNKIKTPKCEQCRFFVQNIIYKSDGVCLKDNEVVRYFYVCSKLNTDDERREAKKF